jgi:hypothetical protein
MTIIQRPSLVYPGTPPGIDWSHPASQNLGLSLVALGKDFLQLTAPVAPTRYSTAPTLGVSSLIGPTTAFAAAGNTGISYPNAIPNFPQSRSTFAGIVQYGAAGSLGWAGNGAVSPFPPSFGLYFSAGTLGVYYGSSGGMVASSIPNLIAGQPYFCAASCLSGVGVNFVLRNLATGQIWTSSATNTNAFPASNNYVTIGDPGGAGAASTSPIARFMYASNYLSIPQLYQWGQSPWSFWHPYAGTMRPAWFSQGASGGAAATPFVQPLVFM